MAVETTPGTAASPTCDDLNERRQEQLQLLRDLRYFQRKNKLERPARYEVSKLYHYGLVLTIVIVESVANAFFFAQGNELGWLGGLVQALMISVVNVGSGVAVGKFWLPEKNHIQPSRRITGLVAIPVFLLVSITFNLVAGHYRDHIALHPEGGVGASIGAMLSSPFSFSFDSFMLFLTGVIASLLGVWKGYTEDDIYPGYGEIDRQYNEARIRFIDLRRQLPQCKYDAPEAGDDE